MSELNNHIRQIDSIQGQPERINKYNEYINSLFAAKDL